MNPDVQDKPGQTPGRILVVDDDDLTLKNIRRLLGKAGHKISAMTSPTRALNKLAEDAFDLLITDLRMPHMDGLTLLNQAKRRTPDLEVILITGYASLDGAVEATKQGAFHYLAKPFTPDQLREIVTLALAQKRLRDQGARRNFAGPGPVIIGRSPKIRQLEEAIRHIAPTDCNVLIIGESGTGKELFAKAIHAHSRRAKGPFVAFNCGAFTEDLISNELFGHEKDAYTGATSRKAGLLEAASGGTLFLDEIGEMPFSMQVKLLRVIQEREVIRVGGTRAIPLDIRILAASAGDLKTAATEGAFRQDLYFRLNVVNIVLPRLNERRQDIPLLAYHVLEKLDRRMKKKVKAISPEAMALLTGYAFPGNVRELENIIERAMAVCQGETIQVRDLPPDLADLELYSYQRPDGPALTLEELEKDYISHVLEITGGVRTHAAKILGIDRASLWRKIKKYGLD